MKDNSIISVGNLNLWYGEHQALKDINIEIERNSITALIGPSGCGKSTFLKTLDRMNDLIPEMSDTTEKISFRSLSMSASFGGRSAWFFKSRTRFP